MLEEKQNLINDMKKDFGSVLDVMISSSYNTRKSSIEFINKIIY